MIESVIKLKVDSIAECVLNNKSKDVEEDFGLYTGQFGIYDFLSRYYSLEWAKIRFSPN